MRWLSAGRYLQVVPTRSFRENVIAEAILKRLRDVSNISHSDFVDLDAIARSFSSSLGVTFDDKDHKGHKACYSHLGNRIVQAFLDDQPKSPRLDDLQEQIKKLQMENDRLKVGPLPSAIPF